MLKFEQTWLQIETVLIIYILIIRDGAEINERIESMQFVSIYECYSIWNINHVLFLHYVIVVPIMTNLILSAWFKLCYPYMCRPQLVVIHVWDFSVFITMQACILTFWGDATEGFKL